MTRTTVDVNDDLLAAVTTALDTTPIAVAPAPCGRTPRYGST